MPIRNTPKHHNSAVAKREMIFAKQHGESEATDRHFHMEKTPGAPVVANTHRRGGPAECDGSLTRMNSGVYQRLL
jgi:hypothetical protein